MTIDDLRQMQSLPLDMKIKLTKDRIREWVRAFGENGVYISFSGGKDSTVLLHIVREDYPNIEAVFINTGLEYPEIQVFAQSFDNVRTVYPEMQFSQVIRRYGYPVLTKQISHSVNIARRYPNGKTAKNRFDPNGQGIYAMYKWKDLLETDFIISDKCCDVMKKKTAKAVDKKPFVATMTYESKKREELWLENGCNAFDLDDPKSAPMSFWIEQDVLEYIYTRKIPICKVYGDVIYGDRHGQLGFDGCSKMCTTGCQRTGCVYCLYGAHLEKGEGRLQRLKETHRKQYDYCIGGGSYDDNGIWKPDKNGLGMGHVIDEMNRLYGKNFIRY